MALFKISKGEKNNLATNRPYANEGNAYFTTDDGKFYIDTSGNGTTDKAIIGTNRIPLNANKSDALDYSTAAPTQDNTDGVKIVVLENEPTQTYDGYFYIITGPKIN